MSNMSLTCLFAMLGNAKWAYKQARANGIDELALKYSAITNRILKAINLKLS